MNSFQRITNLDFIRGFAVLGILVINVISFGLPITAIFNHSAYGVSYAVTDELSVSYGMSQFEYENTTLEDQDANAISDRKSVV